MSPAERASGLYAPLAPMPEAGAMFDWHRTVRTGDVDPDERLRLDGVARYLQDIAFDHIDAMSALHGEINPVWVVRRSVIDVRRPISWRSGVHLQRWCSAMSTRWATMRVRIDGSDGGLIETEGFWININRETGTPARISEALEEDLRARTTEHRLRWRPMLTDAASGAGGSNGDSDGASDGHCGGERPFPLRSTDVDPLAHLNNAVYLHPVEQLLTRAPALRDRPHRVVVEYLRPIEPAADLRIRWRIGDDGVFLWYLVDGVEHARAAAVEHP